MFILMLVDLKHKQEGKMDGSHSSGIIFRDDILLITLNLIPMDLSSGADETATMAAAAEWQVCVPISHWDRGFTHTAAATPFRVPAHGSSPSAPGHHGI